MSKHIAFKTISIFGGSASGKSSLAKVLESYDGNKFSRVAVDRLIKEKQVDDKEYFKKPIEYDWEFLENLLANTKLDDCITLPAFDYSTFTRTSKISDKIFKVTEYLIFDAIEPYLKADFLFYINTPVEVRKQRTIERDEVKGIDVMKNWEWNLLSDEYYRTKYGNKAIILDGTVSIEELKNKLLKFLQ
ncbi:hypothetical protein KBD45_06790 [Candidatus Dojkabacteria bacterium]|nr:hypothetical protein [Candidatus Dojkabacteria bacterium]